MPREAQTARGGIIKDRNWSLLTPSLGQMMKSLWETLELGSPCSELYLAAHLKNGDDNTRPVSLTKLKKQGISVTHLEANLT